MNEMWAIAMGDDAVDKTNAATKEGAWYAFYWIVQEFDFTLADFTETYKRRGYTAVRLKYEIVERDGEASK